MNWRHAMHDTQTIDAVKDYYGRVLTRTQDLKTSACCSAEALPGGLRELVRSLHPEVKDRFYGCGSPFPPALEGRTVLDLGCGSGRDVYLLSHLVGPGGKVIGIDMTDEQLAVARRHVDYHTQMYGYTHPNVEFVQGYIEDLAAAGIADAAVDLVVSNCVVNLSPDKRRVLREIFRVLKPGGELYFSDVYADRRIPAALQQDPVLFGECLSGALYLEDFRRLMDELGCADFRTMSQTPIAIGNADIERRIGMIGFSSITVRAFKLALEDRCEDYGQVAVYAGTIPDQPHVFVLDDHHRLETGRPLRVCGNTAAMLSQTWYAPHVEIRGDTSRHFGLFDCAPAAAPAAVACPPGGGCC